MRRDRGSSPEERRRGMKCMVTAVVAVFVISTLAVAVPIRDVQYTTDPSGDSPLVGQEVTVTGIVTGEWYAFDEDSYFLQDAPGAWNGIMVYDPVNAAAEGDSITVTGTVAEYYGLTEISDVTSFAIHSHFAELPEPAAVTTAMIATGSDSAEAYEGVLVRIAGDITVTNGDLGYGEWEIDDGSGPCRADDDAPYYYYPETGDALVSVTGVLTYDYGDFKLEPRLTRDVVEAGPYTSVQWVQQVRMSDLMRTDNYGTGMDQSYAVGDTLTFNAIVTAPTGLFYAGAGVKFIMADRHGGPWSGLLSYDPDSTAFPVLIPGDEIAVTGYISEYVTGTDGANMTELFITEEIQILSIGNPVPEPVKCATGILLDEWTAEQFGTVFVTCDSATLVYEADANGVWGIDDGSGLALVDDDSDSLYGTYEEPPVGAFLEKVTGWLYHHDYYSTLGLGWYYIEPLGPSSIVVGGIPPVIRSTMRDPGAPTSSDDVTVSAEITDDSGVDQNNVFLHYEVGTRQFVDVLMTTVDDTLYSAAIPAQAEGSVVTYFLSAMDDSGGVSVDPDTSLSMYFYYVKDTALTPYEVQYTPYTAGDSPYEDYELTLSGICTADTQFYDGFYLQGESGQWHGIFVEHTDFLPLMGDEVQVTGTVQEDYNRTQVEDVTDVQVLSSGNPLPDPVLVPTGELGTGTPTAESYEGVLLRVEDVEVTSLLSYGEWEMDDGSGPYLADDRCWYPYTSDPADPDTTKEILTVGWGFTHIVGIGDYTFSTYKLQPRSADDFGVYHSVPAEEGGPRVAPTFALRPCYPNPAGREGTTISYRLPQHARAQLVVYNARGQVIKVLADAEQPAGTHTVGWDGTDMSGSRVPTGIYMYRLKAGPQIASRRIVFVR
jgi:hypothetical protein